MEGFEDAALAFGIDANAGIAHLYLENLTFPCEFQLDASMVRELYCVIDQMPQQILNARGIAYHGLRQRRIESRCQL